MPLLGFKEQFAEKILDGTKKHTMRNPRKIPIQAGDTLYMYTGLRTKDCKHICNKTCVRVAKIQKVSMHD